MTALSEHQLGRSRKKFQNEFQTISLPEIEATLSTWRGMLSRCFSEGTENYENYGARGITVCPRWFKFTTFLDDMGPRPEGFTIDRIDNDGNYEPGNCRRATPREQGSNKRNNVYIEIDGQRITQSEVARIAGVSDATVMRRMESGYSLEDVIGGRGIKKIKLCANDAATIRRYLSYGLHVNEVAQCFGISGVSVRSIRRGATWHR